MNWDDAEAARQADRLAFRAGLARAQDRASRQPGEWAALARANLQAASDTCRDVIARGKTTERRAWHLADIAAQQAAECRASREAVDKLVEDKTS